MSKTRFVETSNKQVQTTIHCYPHILVSDTDPVKVLSDRGCQTTTTAVPKTKNSDIYALLQFTPYNEIADDCLREVDLPRKPLLQWQLSQVSQSVSLSARKSFDKDDSELKSALKKLTVASSSCVIPLLIHHYYTMQKSIANAEIQTTLSVWPHVLDADEVANVRAEISIQTSITGLPNESITSILPRLKANLYHSGEYTSSRFSLSKSSIGETVAEAVEDVPEEVTEDPLEDELELEISTEPIEVTEGEAAELTSEVGNDLEFIEADYENENVVPEASLKEESPKAVSITLSASKIKNEHICKCGANILSQIASQLKVQASTLKLTKDVFPPGTRFEERIVEVLNATMAVLQIEMAKLMESCIEDKVSRDCYAKIVQESGTVDANKVLTFSENDQPKLNNNEIDKLNDPASCACNMIGNRLKHVDPSNVETHREVKKTTITRQIINPITLVPDYITEDVIEESTKTITLSDNNETVVEKIVKTSIKEKPHTKFEKGKPCSNKTCEYKDESAGVIKHIIAPIVENDIMQAVIARISSSTDFQETSEAQESEQTTQTQVATPSNIETVGDYTENKRVAFIPCECTPTAAGAAVPTVLSPISSENRQRFEEKNVKQCECVDEESITEAAASTAANEEQSMLTDDAPSLTDDVLAADVLENTVKFEFLLKNGSKNVESSSAMSAIVVRATISCPNTNIRNPKKNIQARSSLPDLREQVIRLSVIYKNGSKTETEERLVSGRQITVTPNKAQSSHINQNSKPVLQNKSINNLCNCSDPLSSGPTTLKVSPNKNDRSFAATNKISDVAHFCECGRKITFKRQPKPPNNLHLQTEKVAFSSMACPAHAKPPSCLTSGAHTSTPPSTTIGSRIGKTELEITISFDPDGIDKNTDNKEDTVDFLYEHDTTYNEPYMEELVEILAGNVGVQTDLMLGDKLESESLSSLTQEVIEDGDDKKQVCGSKTEIPWQKISLPEPGTYSIKPVEKKIVQVFETKTVEPETTDNQINDTNVLEETQYDDLNTSAENEETAIDLPDAEATVNESVAEEDAEILEEDDLGAESLEGEGGGEGANEEGEPEGPDEGGEETEEPEGPVEEAEEEEQQPESPKEEEEIEEPTISVMEPEKDVCGEPEFKRRKRREPLIYEHDFQRENEPYMESLYRAFPNSDEEIVFDCGFQTEMPWKDIILPEHCKIKRVKKTKKCTCTSGLEKLPGTLVSSNKSPKQLSNQKDDDLLVIHVGFEEPSSRILTVDHKVECLDADSAISALHELPKRVEKNYTLVVNISHSDTNDLSFQAEKGISEKMSLMKSTSGKASGVHTVSVTNEIQEKTSKGTFNIKSSTECKFVTDKASALDENRSTELNVVEPLMFLGSIPTETKSCVETSVSHPSCNLSTKSGTKNAASMPHIPSHKSLSAKVSVKRMGEPEQVVSQKMDLVPGENVMTLKVPNEPITVQLKMSAPDNKVSTQKIQTETPITPALQQQKDVFTPAQCNCKDKIKPDTFKTDPVMAALEAYEAEMKPIRQALTQLQQKIRNLNMPEMKGCLCTLTPSSGGARTETEPTYPTTRIRSKVKISKKSDGGITTTTRIRSPPTAPCSICGGLQEPCPYFRPPALGRLPPQPPMYSNLPNPMTPPRYQSYLPPSPNYTPPSMDRYRQSCSYGQDENAYRSSNLKRYSKQYCPFYREDLLAQAKNYGICPDYRGRNYMDDQAAYRDSFMHEPTCRMSNQKKRYKVRNTISLHSSGNATSDNSAHDNQYPSDRENLTPTSSKRCRKCEKGKHKRHHSSKHSSRSSSKLNKCDNYTSSRDYNDSQYIRSGQAVKTSPEDFLPSSSRASKQKSACHPCESTGSKILSKTKMHIKHPRK